MHVQFAAYLVQPAVVLEKIYVAASFMLQNDNTMSGLDNVICFMDMVYVTPCPKLIVMSCPKGKYKFFS